MIIFLFSVLLKQTHFFFYCYLPVFFENETLECYTCIFKQKTTVMTKKLRSEEQSCSFSLYIHREKVPLPYVGPDKTLQKGNIFCIFLFLTLLSSDFYPYFKSSSLPFSNDCPKNPHLCDSCQANSGASKMSSEGWNEGDRSLLPDCMRFFPQDSSLTIMDLHLPLG